MGISQGFGYQLFANFSGSGFNQVYMRGVASGYDVVITGHDRDAPGLLPLDLAANPLDARPRLAEASARENEPGGGEGSVEGLAGRHAIGRVPSRYVRLGRLDRVEPDVRGRDQTELSPPSARIAQHQAGAADALDRP